MFDIFYLIFWFKIDGVVGEVLFWSIRLCTGPSVYTYDVHQAWVKIYSRMLRTMVPLAVSHELRDGSAQEKRFLGDSIGLSLAEESVLNDFQSAHQEAETGDVNAMLSSEARTSLHH